MNNISISRPKSLVHKVVMVDGQPGCGKSMLSPIIASFKRVELLSYLFELEHISRLFKLKKITKDANIAMIKMLIDNKIYQTMMGRDTNFRYSDVSSVFNYTDPKKYFKRIFSKGDQFVPSKIKKEKPILNLSTHDLLISAESLFEALGNKLVFVEVIRHPLYMLIQQTLNMKNLIDNPRDIEIYFNKNNFQYPYFAFGWENTFRKSNLVEKAIHTIAHHTLQNNKIRKILLKKYNKNFICIPFEEFVLRPDNFLIKLKKIIGTDFSKKTKKILIKQRVPRTKIADSIPLDIYKRCGWKSPNKFLNEKEELNIRREYALKNKASKSSIKILDKLSKDYEKKYLDKISID